MKLLKDRDFDLEEAKEDFSLEDDFGLDGLEEEDCDFDSRNSGIISCFPGEER